MPVTFTRHLLDIAAGALKGTALLLCLLALMIAAGYEYNANNLFHKAEKLQNRQNYLAAFTAYQLVIERHPFSWKVPHARVALKAMAPAVNTTWPRLRRTLLERRFGARFSPYAIDQLPLLAWPIATLFLLIVFLTRLSRRKGWALIALLLSLPAISLTVFVWLKMGIVRWKSPGPPVVPGPFTDYAALVYWGAWLALLVAFSMLFTPVLPPKKADRSSRNREPDESPSVK